VTQFATQFALPSLVASLVALACGLAVIARERFSNSGWLHFFLAASVALWQLCISGMLGATNPADAARWVRAAVASVILLPAIQFHFSYSLTRGRTNRVDAVTWVWVGTAILEGVLLLSDQFVTGHDVLSLGRVSALRHRGCAVLRVHRRDPRRQRVDLRSR
jgi:hypothetical protein